MKVENVITGGRNTIWGT